MSRPPIDYIERTAELYASLDYPIYKWVNSEEPPPWTPVNKPISKSRVSLIASGGIYLEGQVAFGFKDDISFREIDKNVRVEDLRVTHFAYDLTDARKDPNVVFPLDRLLELEHADGGAVAPRSQNRSLVE